MNRNAEQARGGDWRDRAACRHTDPELFFPVGTSGPALRQIGRAMEVCGACPVRKQCLAWALDRALDFGIWGGTTEDQRRVIRRIARRPRSA
jgi:WhiB family redox-sensing transcriptional regulator